MKIPIPTISFNNQRDTGDWRSAQPIMDLRDTFDSERYREWKYWLRRKRKAPQRGSGGA